MNIYIASYFDTRDRLKPIKAQIEQLGHRVVSRWLDVPGSPPEGMTEATYFTQEAMRDIEDIDRCDYIIVDTFDVTQRGGREVELGYFMGKKGTVMIATVGPKRNVFHYIVGANFATWEDCIRALHFS